MKLNHVFHSKPYTFPQYHTIFTFTGKKGLAAHIKGFPRVKEKAILPWEENPQALMENTPNQKKFEKVKKPEPHVKAQ